MNLFSIPSRRKIRMILGDTTAPQAYHCPHITTFAILEGLVAEKENNTFFKRVEQWSKASMRGDFYCFDREKNSVSVYNRIETDTKTFARHGIRPCIEGDSFNRAREHFKFVKRLSFFSSAYIAELGEYVGDVVSYKKSGELSQALQRGEVKKLDKTFASQIGPLPVYQYKNQKFVLYKTNSIIDCRHSIFSDSYNVDWYDGGLFLEVKPLRFLVVDYFDIALCESVVQAGIDVGFEEGMDFEDSSLMQYLNSTFLKDILPPHSELLPYVNQTEIEEQKNSDIGMLVEKIDVLSSKLGWIHELVMPFVSTILSEYNRDLEDLKGSVHSFGTTKLSLEPTPTKDDIKNRLLNKLEGIFKTLSSHYDYYASYFKMLDVVYPVTLYSKGYSDSQGVTPSAQDEAVPMEIELERDLRVVGNILCTFDEESQEALEVKLTPLLTEFARTIEHYLENTLFISFDELQFKKLEDIESLEELELRFRRLWQDFLFELDEQSQVSVLKKRLFDEIERMCENIYKEANDCMISVYLNELNKVAKRIRAAIRNLPMEDRAGELEMLFDILKAKPDAYSTSEELLRFTWGKIRLLHQMEDKLDSYLREVKAIDSYKFFK